MTRPFPIGDQRTTAGVYIIAEASGNHQHSLDMALQLVQAAAWAGADAIKFQTYTVEELAAANVPVLFGHDANHDARLRRIFPDTPTPDLQHVLWNGGLPRAWHAALKEAAATHGITFLSTPFSVNAAKFLVEDIGVSALKIASGDVTYTPLLDYADSTGLPVILSTGASTLEEIATAGTWHLDHAYEDRKLVLMHCVSAYPCPVDAANLRAIATLATRFPFATPGWSDHTTNTRIPAVAVACGARVIEKHLRLPQMGYSGILSMDTEHSLTPNVFACMVRNIREAEQALGTGEKAPHSLELHDRLWMRRSARDWLRPTDEARRGQWH